MCLRISDRQRYVPGPIEPTFQEATTEIRLRVLAPVLNNCHVDCTNRSTETFATDGVRTIRSPLSSNAPVEHTVGGAGGASEVCG